MVWYNFDYAEYAHSLTIKKNKNPFSSFHTHTQNK